MIAVYVISQNIKGWSVLVDILIFIGRVQQEKEAHHLLMDVVDVLSKPCIYIHCFHHTYSELNWTQFLQM